MYVADSLKRVNDQEYKRLMSKNHDITYCDYCEELSTITMPIYNPADYTRGMKHEPYAMLELCQEHYDEGWHMEESFYCPECGELFILNHSWDVVATMVEGEYYCQKCALEMVEPVELQELLSDMRDGTTNRFLRINGVPGKNPIFECEYSGYSDFTGHTNLSRVANDLENYAQKKMIDKHAMIIPLVTHGYQFSVCLGFYNAN